MTYRAVPSFVLLLMLVVACGMSQRQKVLSTTFAAINSARDGFIAYDKQHQLDIVAKASTKVDATSKLTAYRDKRSHVVELFAATYRVLSAALLLDDSQSLTSLIAAADQLKAALDEIKKE